MNHVSASLPKRSTTEAVVSVVVPVYNVERYLHECLESIRRQTLENIAIIVVDDGSTDGSGRIADEFESRDARFKILHKENGGYGSAINAGLDVATGRYVAIVESDDWIEPTMLARLFEAAEESGAGVVKGNFRKILPSGGSHRMSFAELVVGPDGIIDPAASPELMVYESSIWTALYRRSGLLEHDIRMPETKGASYQDVVWKFRTLALMRPVRLIDEPFYNYRVLAAGSSSRRSDNADAHFVNYSLIRQQLEGSGVWPEFRFAFFAHQFFDFVFHHNRLSRDAVKTFEKRAIEVLAEADGHGVTPRSVRRRLATNRYFNRHVYPFLLRLQAARDLGRRRYASAAAMRALSLVRRVLP